MINWVDKHIEVPIPAKPKKITGTRFGAILGKNVWSTPFKAWCEITHTYEEPFEYTIYTIAGKTIEPKQIDYMKRVYHMDNLKTPTDIFGENYFDKTHGDFFRDYSSVFGGMWDSILVDEYDMPNAVLEFKTTKRAEDWVDDVPEYYALQASLYAWLLKVDRVIMVCSFLDNDDYAHPEEYTPSADNTITVEFKVSERYASFEILALEAKNWYHDHVETGVSPDYDPNKDADIIKILRTTTVAVAPIQEMIEQAEMLQTRLAKIKAEVENDEKKLDELKKAIKQYGLDHMGENDDKILLNGKHFDFEIARVSANSINKNLLEADGLLDHYTTTSVSYRLNIKTKESN